MFATRVRTRRCSFATARSIAKLKPPLCSAESKLPIGIKIPFSTKCGEWMIYAEPVTYALYKMSTYSGVCVCIVVIGVWEGRVREGERERERGRGKEGEGGRSWEEARRERKGGRGREEFGRSKRGSELRRSKEGSEGGR